MVRARAASRIGASIPFGAAHRVYFDTPPLKGLRLEPFRFHLETCRAAETYRKTGFCWFHLEPQP
jgi:hypothetical protein